MSAIERPDQPNRELLERASLRVAPMLGVDDSSSIQWRVLRRLDRPSSTLFLVEAIAPGGSVRAYAKQAIPPPYEPERRQRWVDRARAGLERGDVLETRLFEMLDPSQVRFSRTLAVDLPTLSVVTLEVVGEPFGKPWRHLFGGERRAQAAEWLHRVGEVVRTIEKCTQEKIDVDTEARAAAVERRLERVSSVLPAETLSRVEQRMWELDSMATAGGRPLIYAHGDLSPTNILVGDQLGLIDFTWPPMVRGFDIAHLAFRLEYDTMAPAGLTAPLVKSLVDGYGDVGLTDSAAWHFTRMTKLLKIVEGAGRWSADPRVRRALGEIEMI